jgi:Cof subfamily protein (haloacid dehalogenase superfamily)
MDFKVVCTDIDGTLLDTRRELSDFSIETFRSLPANVRVILASSRMPSAMTHLQKELGKMNSPLICYNGALVLHFPDGASRTILHSVVIPVDVCEKIVRLSLRTDIHVSLYYEDEWYAPEWDHWSEREATITKVTPLIRPLADVLSMWRGNGSGGHKVMCMGPEQEIDVMENELRAAFANDIHIYRSRPTYLELAPGSVSKGSALKLLLERTSEIAMDDVIAFGDNYNDIELLQMAGRGVAVRNARQDVIAIADEITLDSKADGVATTLKRLMNGNR